ncbi:MAG: type II toxin-antitoxin system Phd/YefM family antitoxin [Gammaproteobacteria bacterium]|nr:type II toxin-antitoxin system Phd/YefM family antitoxin [Gammaproteobacteria bacterium]MCY4276367.1 type II toxin-antitoxin system Phd/YefM family antitoxin [Gammaproteobacteria bacterium]MCY4322779.1 type II toxin-antitoxin system Phd/YefM family antitoxin [Gammaproteobacteria bacterium]
MKILSLSEAKMKLSAIIDNVLVTEEEVVITKNGAPAAVLVSPDEFESLRETAAVKSDAALIEEIKQGLHELDAGLGKRYTLEELFEDSQQSGNQR